MIPMPEPIPLVDLGLQHAAVAEEVNRGFERVMEAASFILGREVTEFEEAFARYCGTSECVSLANGTDAIELALRAAGVGPGAEVVLPANSYVATAEAVMRAGATPILVDCDPVYQLIDVGAAKSRMGRRTSAVIPVHLFGQLAPMEPIAKVAGQAGATVIEDAAQCQGATQHGRGPGSLSLGAATSFYPGKNLGAYGDAGAVMTNHPELARRVRLIRNHGGRAKYEHEELGFNSRMDTLQAVVLLAKLAHLERWNEERRQAACRYHHLLAGVEEATLPATLAGNQHVWHLYVVRVPRRDAVIESLHRAGVQAGIHYPVPIHMLKPFADLGYRLGEFPAAEAAARQMLSLPLFPGITVVQQERVAEALWKALR